jgi:hypothetical protein
MGDAKRKDFATISQQRAGRTLCSELLEFLLHNKKWWLVPILLVLGLFGVLAIFSGSAAAPFIYTLF